MDSSVDFSDAHVQRCPRSAAAAPSLDTSARALLEEIRRLKQESEHRLMRSFQRAERRLAATIESCFDGLEHCVASSIASVSDCAPIYDDFDSSAPVFDREPVYDQYADDDIDEPAEPTLHNAYSTVAVSRVHVEAGAEVMVAVDAGDNLDSSQPVFDSEPVYDDYGDDVPRVESSSARFHSPRLGDNKHPTSCSMASAPASLPQASSTSVDISEPLLAAVHVATAATTTIATSSATNFDMPVICSMKCPIGVVDDRTDAGVFGLHDVLVDDSMVAPDAPTATVIVPSEVKTSSPTRCLTMGLHIDTKSGTALIFCPDQLPCAAVVLWEQQMNFVDWQPWPPPILLVILHDSAGIRPIPWPSFNMSNGCPASELIFWIWKPPWLVLNLYSHQHPGYCSQWVVLGFIVKEKNEAISCSFQWVWTFLGRTITLYHKVLYCWLHSPATIWDIGDILVISCTLVLTTKFELPKAKCYCNNQSNFRCLSAIALMEFLNNVMLRPPPWPSFTLTAGCSLSWRVKLIWTIPVPLRTRQNIRPVSFMLLFRVEVCAILLQSNSLSVHLENQVREHIRSTRVFLHTIALLQQKHQFLLDILVAISSDCLLWKLPWSYVSWKNIRSIALVEFVEGHQQRSVDDIPAAYKHEPVYLLTLARPTRHGTDIIHGAVSSIVLQMQIQVWGIHDSRWNLFWSKNHIGINTNSGIAIYYHFTKQAAARYCLTICVVADRIYWSTSTSHGEAFKVKYSCCIDKDLELGNKIMSLELVCSDVRSYSHQLLKKVIVSDAIQRLSPYHPFDMELMWPVKLSWSALIAAVLKQIVATNNADGAPEILCKIWNPCDHDISGLGASRISSRGECQEPSYWWAAQLNIWAQAEALSIMETYKRRSSGELRHQSIIQNKQRMFVFLPVVHSCIPNPFSRTFWNLTSPTLLSFLPPSVPGC